MGNHCPGPRALQCLLAHGLGAAEAKAVEAHVETCAGCQQALERLTTAARARTEADPSPQVGEGFLRQLGKGRPVAPKTPSPDGQTLIDPPARPPGRALLEKVLPRPEAEVQALLQQRLLLTSLIGTVALGLRALTQAGGYTLRSDASPFIARVELGMAVGLAVSAAILWQIRELSLRRLRLIELGGFGVVMAGQVVLTSAVFRDTVPASYAGLGDRGVAVLASYVCLPWFAMVVLYGTFIPNTWRRCAAVVGVMAGTPLLVSAVRVLSDAALDPATRVAFLSQLVWWLGFAAAIAVYGCHKISVLRQEVSRVRQLGQYQLKRRIGSGGMGEVYLAEHVLLRRPCAVKLIRPERASDPKILLRFEREVQATAALSHPNTVEVFDYGHADDGTFYYAMEYLPGQSLAQLVSGQGPLEAGRAVHLLRQVCGALCEAHTAGLVHRDIKPSNVLVCDRGGVRDVAKLLDFGLVRGPKLDGQTLTQEGTIAGTPTYMSPEQAKGTELDGRSDVYSLGAVAYFLLTGQPPFVRETAAQAMAAHLAEPVVPPARHRPEVPADLQAVVLRCLEKKPVKRFQSAEELEQALTRCACATWRPGPGEAQ